jgi:hypothetical protein
MAPYTSKKDIREAIDHLEGEIARDDIREENKHTKKVWLKYYKGKLKNK